MGIVEIDPIEADLLFERFLTEGRDSPPDFDVDYPTSKRDLMQDHCTERWGADHVLRVGSHIRLRNKGAIKAVAITLKSTVNLHWPDIEAISKVIDKAEMGTSGLGLKWDELWAQAGDELEPYRVKYPEVFLLAERMVGRLKTYSRHAAGMVISTDESLVGRLPLRSSEESNQPISEFDMEAIELLGLLKFDILTLRTLDTLQECLDMIQAIHGQVISLYDWSEEYLDPQVWDEICAGHTKGMFQIETAEGTRLTKRFQPRSISELADVITLVRPGPMRSGLTESYLRRRAGNEEIILPDERLAAKLLPTQGTIIYQEQVMAACQILGGYSLEEAEVIRRILGKKKVEEAKKAGQGFIDRCASNGMDRDNAMHLWEKLEEFSKYSFNKSHAWAYAMIGFWTAWFKIHYPSIFLTAILSTVDGKRVPEFVQEARRMGYKVLPPDVNESGRGFKPIGGTTVRYGLQAIADVGPEATARIIAGQPYASVEDFVERSGVNSKIRGLVARCGALDSLYPHRRSLEARFAWQTDGSAKWCQNKDETVIADHGLPCRYPWGEEPVMISIKGKPQPRKPPPKRCTVGCRQFLAPEMPDFDGMSDYSSEEVRGIEKSLLGIYLSSTPFDVIPDETLDECSTHDDIDVGPLGEYVVVAVIERVRATRDRNGKDMAFVGLQARNGILDCVVFKNLYQQVRQDLLVDRLCYAVVEKTARGLQINAVEFPSPDPF